MMTWNHRVLAYKDGDDWYFQIHEVFYDKDNIPESYTKDGISVGAEDLEGITWVLDKMKKCLSKPILSAENFPKEWIKN